MNNGSLVWRVGHVSAPLDFPPREALSWKNRFDDPGRVFRTLYCSERRPTALREVLADFRPNAKARAEYRALFGEELPPPRIKEAWLQERILVRGEIRVLHNELVNIDDPALRHQFEQRHADLLARHGMDHLDVAQIRSKNRPVTQAVTRFAAEWGAASIIYGSNLDDLPCAALFEGRSLLVPVSGPEPEPLTASHPDLVAVCGELGLILVEG